MRSVRLLLAAMVLGTTAVSGATVAVDAAGRQACGGQVSDDGGGWKAIRPHFTRGPQSVLQAVVTPYDPDRVYVTNGDMVLRSDDAGCTWSALVVPDPGARLSALPAPLDGVLKIPSTAHIASIAAPSSATANDRLYVAINDQTVIGDVPWVEYSRNAGNSWQTAAGLPNFGTLRELAACDNLPDSVYALIDPANRLSTDGGIYASGDGGATFAPRNSSVTSATLHDLQVNPTVNTTIYGLGKSGLQASVDGGMNFHQALRPATDIASYDVTGGAGSVRYVVGHSRTKSYDRSNDGLTSTPVRAPVRAALVAMQPIIDQVAVSDGHQLWREPGDAVSLARNITPGHGPPTSDLQFTAPDANGYAVLGLRAGVLLRTTLSLTGHLVPSVGVAPVQLLPQAAVHQFPSTLTPHRSHVALRPGAHRDVSYRLLLPRTPSPVDVMFLVDTSSSTEYMIDGLKTDLARIVNDLSGVGLDAQFGVADFKDYSPSVADRGDGELGDYPYRLDRVIGPADSSLRNALARLRASGGGDPPESQLTALYQSTTGAGQHYPHKQRYLRYLHPGDDARYRTGSLRLAVLATDARFHRERSYLTPSWDSTLAALRSHHVFPIGLAMEAIDDQSFKTGGYKSLSVEQELARDAGSLAPPGGLDCNDDLVPDVAAGAPFVCKVSVVVKRRPFTIGRTRVPPKVLPVRLGPAVTVAAETLPDMKTVGLQFTGAPHGLARVVRPGRLPQVNLKNDNSLDFTVRYTCPRAAKPHRYDVGVNAAAGVRVVASSAMSVACGAVRPPPAAHVPPPAAAVAVAVAPAAVPAPPAPGNPIPNPNPNPNPAINANVGFASQEEEQRQLAFAGADAGAGVEPEPGGEMAMSRLSRPPGSSASEFAEAGYPTPDSGGSDGWWFGGSALVLTAAAGYAARRRTQLRARTACASTGRSTGASRRW